jgi:hypothetical protein
VVRMRVRVKGVMVGVPESEMEKMVFAWILLRRKFLVS